GTTVAVEVFKLERQGASKSFVAECEALKNARHRNLGKIVTACPSMDYHGNDFKALILQRSDDLPRSLSFLEILNIATDVASALDYLHHQCQMPIVHCDDKHSFARQSSSVGVRGTVGYAPPGINFPGT
ncbi:unnamed protein product, partial [Linum tenue]